MIKEEKDEGLHKDQKSEYRINFLCESPEEAGKSAKSLLRACSDHNQVLICSAGSYDCRVVAIVTLETNDFLDLQRSLSLVFCGIKISFEIYVPMPED